MDQKIGVVKKRQIYADILRILAIFFVIFNHTNQRGYVRFTLYEIESVKYWFTMFFSLIAGINVPIFFMISGMFLLGKQEETIGYIWKRRIPRYIFVLLFFSALHYFRNIGFNVHSFSIKECLRLTYTNGVIIPYWFIYVYIAFLIALPFIRKMAANFTEREFLYIVGLYILFNAVISILQYRLSQGTLYIYGNLSPSFLFGSTIIYPLIGYYLGTRVKTVKTKNLLVCSALFVVSVIITAYMTNYKIKLTGDLGEGTVSTFYGAFRPIQVVFVFLLVRKLLENRKFPLVFEKVVVSIGKCTFGIYLIEQALRESLYFIYDKMCTKINDFLAIMIYVAMIILIGWIIISLGKLIDWIFIKLFGLIFSRKKNTATE